MSTAAQRRLLKDLQRIQKDQNSQFIVTPQKGSLFLWSATIEGAEGTLWQGGLFTLRLQFTQKYPNSPPKVKFITQMFHPNIYHDGRICLDMLQNQWSPIYDVWAVLTAIKSLLADPNPLSPANPTASNIFKDNKILYEKKVKQIVQKSLEQDFNVEDFQQQKIQKPEQHRQIQIKQTQNIQRRGQNLLKMRQTQLPQFSNRISRLLRRKSKDLHLDFGQVQNNSEGEFNILNISHSSDNVLKSQELQDEDEINENEDNNGEFQMQDLDDDQDNSDQNQENDLLNLQMQDFDQIFRQNNMNNLQIDQSQSSSSQEENNL